MQIRKDIVEGRLVCPESSAALLGSYAVQCKSIGCFVNNFSNRFAAEFGDYCLEEHGDNYLHGYQMLPNQTASFTKKLEQLHKLHRSVYFMIIFNAIQ
jgi:hypothetical protein